MNNQRIIIIGGGISGLLTALALAKSGVSVTVIEKKPFLKTKDGRSFAISANSKDLLVSYGLWEDLSCQSGPIKQIRITNNNSPLFLHFGEESANNQPMGYMVPAGLLMEKIYSELRLMENLTILTDVTYTQVTFQDEQVIVELDTGDILQANLLIAAEGKFSNLRNILDIKTTTIPYNQAAFVFNIWHQFHHNFIALENFYANGPFASLPLYDGHHSAIVWTEKLHLKDCLLQMDQREFLEFFKSKFGDHLGEIKLSTEIQTFELSAIFTETYYLHRAVLIGDTAHAIHPIAGQGLNLTIRDIKSLADLIKNQHNLGLDIGSKLILEKYSKYRQRDNNAMIAATDICNRIFSHNSRTASSVINLGLATINKISNIKKLLVNYAMGYRSK